MARTVAIGIQDFGKIIEKECFYIDKTPFIKEWWESGDDVTLIMRPRRFGKTLNMSMLEHFFSLKYDGRGNLFEGLSIWEDEKYRDLQGTYPVISLSFANVKEKDYKTAREKICQIITNLYLDNEFLIESSNLGAGEKKFLKSVSADMGDATATMALHQLSRCLSKHYGQKVIILLDEYDTPMQEAWMNGYWDEIVSFMRSLFNSTFKTNPYLERAVMTGITRVSKESIFSDLNNLEVVTTTSDKYETAFGFTEEEVFAALDELGLSDRKQEVKKWYDGFTFGNSTDIYNPWSILNYLDKKQLGAYWANTSSNSLAGDLIRRGSKDVKQKLEALMQGETLHTEIDEQIVYGELYKKKNAVWSLLLASGYLKAVHVEFTERTGRAEYELTLTNKEVWIMFGGIIRGWFEEPDDSYNDFIKALLADNLDEMNYYMNKVALATFSTFDTGKKPSDEAEPERFYHGFVLGLLVELSDRYTVTSNRESGFGRYDVVIESEQKDAGIILEFKVRNKQKEKTLKETAQAALRQIQEKQYAAGLLARGIPRECIRSYGFAFEGKTVLIDGGVISSL